MAPFAQERPCIHVAFLGEDESLYRWVQIGAEEEGVPCKLVREQAVDVVALAYAASQSSRFNIGLGISDTEVVLHEMHMPPEQPVVAFKFSGKADFFCRLMGANAARMIIRKPLRFEDEPSPFENETTVQASEIPAYTPPPSQQVTKTETDTPTLSIDPAQVAKIVAVVVQKLQERGLQ
jgi:hypothetical protein